MTHAGGDGAEPEVEAVPDEALKTLDKVRRDRARQGLSGHVMLRIDDAPARPPEWSIIIGETVIRKKDLTSKPH
jgi:hypothetical protein